MERIKTEYELYQRIYSESQLPKLCILQSCSRNDSDIYIRRKCKALAKVGFQSQHFKYTHPPPFAQVVDLIDSLNCDNAVHGILIQQPFQLEEVFCSLKLIEAINPAKDVDGLHPINVASLLSKNNSGAGITPCTPGGILKLLDFYGKRCSQIGIHAFLDIELEGKHVAVIGRSNIVGMPLFHLLSHRNATVTLCHSLTRNLESITKISDIIISATGKAGLIKGSMVQPGALVVDVGINMTAEGNIVGDVEFESVSQVASAITPVPGGVGPMTVAMLVDNLWSAFLRQQKKDLSEIAVKAQ